jgi:hypothetical protein
MCQHYTEIHFNPVMVERFLIFMQMGPAMQSLALKTTINFKRKAWTGVALYNKPRKI